MSQTIDDARRVVGRQRALDVLRAVATIRVVTYHASGDPRWSWFAAMPLMFFIGGALFAQSLDRRPAREVLLHRLRRILVPSAVYVAFVVVVVTIAGAWSEVPPWALVGINANADTAAEFYWTWMHLWYIGAYVVFMVVGVPLRRAVAARPWLTIGIVAAPSVVSGLLRDPAIGTATANLFFWLLGYLYHDHRDRMPSRARFLLAGAAFAAVGIGYGAAITGFNQVVTGIPFLTLTMGMAVVMLAGGTEPWIESVARFRAVDVVVRWFQQRALTVYLWHAAAIGIMHEWVQPHYGSVVSNEVGRIGLTLVLTFGLATLLGWVEDLAAGRPARLFPVVSDRRATRVEPTVAAARVPS